MKHLIKLYCIYFSLLMIVPCNHSVLYAHLAKNVFNIELHQHCHHEHDEQDSQSSHHHSCTPFCACGATHFVLAKPSFNFWVASTIPPIYRLTSTPDVAWATKTNVYNSTLVYDIWNPPQSMC